VHQGKRRGVALVLALLTTVILMTLSLAFMSLSLSEARTSRSYGYEETSLQAASFGIEYALVYMGYGRAFNGTDTIPQFVTWESKKWPHPNDNPSFAFGFFNNLRPTNGPVRLTQASSGGDLITVTVSNATTDPTLRALVPSNLSEFERRTMEDNLRRIRFVTTDGSSVAVRTVGPEYAFSCDVVVSPLLLNRNQGRSDFRLISTAKIFSTHNLGVGASPLATRVVEARVKESSFDYAHFVANARTWNVNGHTVNQAFNITDPNDPTGQRTINMADYVTIPDDYLEQGPMRIDGQDPSKVAGLPATHPLRSVVNASGNLRFLEKANDNNIRFTHKLAINQAENVYPDDVVDSTMGGFNAGINVNAARVGLPDYRRDDMILASKLKVADTDVEGFLEIRNSDIPGARGSSRPAPRHVDPVLGPFYDGYQNVTVAGQTLQVPKPFDYRPRVPNTEITLSGSTVTIVKRDTYSQDPIGAPQVFQVSQLNQGLIYVEGGNVVVKTEGGADDTTGRFRGKLSIVAGERPGRDSMTVNDESIYSQAAREFYNAEKRRWDEGYAQGLRQDPAQFATPPYSVAQLRQARRNGVITADVETGFDADQPLWPKPEVEVDAAGNEVRYKVEREGNVVIADDLVYDKTGGNSLGLFAQNFVLLNDTTPSSELTIDAVMMSAERSVSLDWDNTGRQNPATWAEMMKTHDASGDPLKRKVKIRGSVIGEYIDIEGDLKGRGYVDQEFEYDAGLRNANPPFMPRLDLATQIGGFRFMVLHYLDRGSLSTSGSL
jgi:hypothetical protein